MAHTDPAFLQPTQVPYEMPRSSLYMSPGWDTAEVLLLLTHGTTALAVCYGVVRAPHVSQTMLLGRRGSGSGNVRAGQWARKPCFNDSLQVRLLPQHLRASLGLTSALPPRDQIGSVLPYIKQAHEAGWAVIVLNPNLNEVHSLDVLSCSSPRAHA
jgi:hypothetical protein